MGRFTGVSSLYKGGKRTMTFIMDTKTVLEQGATITKDANDDLANCTDLVYSVIRDESSMPTMFTAALTDFYQNLNTALIAVFNQRCGIGDALQNAATQSEIQELKTAAAFPGHTSQGGLLPQTPG